jgi:hypothetical protein
MFVKPIKGQSVPDPARGDVCQKKGETSKRPRTGSAGKPLAKSK